MSEALIKFETVPPIGTELLLDAQPYALIGSEPRRRLDGQMTTLLVWQALCARCGVPFITRSALSVHALNRRCDLHKRPGSRVGGKRRGTPVKVQLRAPFLPAAPAAGEERLRDAASIRFITPHGPLSAAGILMPVEVD